MKPSHVLVPLDGSPLSEDALTYALEVFDCRVTVLNVLTPLDADMSEGGILEPGEGRTETARERATRLIERATDRAASEGRTVETAIESGDPVETILAYADHNDIDHIVIGGHGGDPKRFLRKMLGTVATAVVSEASVTVTVVREPKSDAGGGY